MMNDLPFPPTYMEKLVHTTYIFTNSLILSAYFGRANFAVEAIFMPLMSFVLYLLCPGEKPIATTIASRAHILVTTCYKMWFITLL